MMPAKIMSVRGERGSTIVLAMLGLFMLSLIILFVSTMTMGSISTSKRKGEQTVGMAAGDSGIEKYRAALQTYLADEANSYLLSQRDLQQLVQNSPGATVLSNSVTSDALGMATVRVPPINRYTVREETSSSYLFWQLFDVLPPRRNNNMTSKPTDLVVYIRAWATAKTSDARISSKPRIFRVEYRPTYYSDYQAISDGPFLINAGTGRWELSAPIHSNGFQGPEWFTGTDTGIVVRSNNILCSRRVRFSTSQGASIGVNPGWGGCGGFDDMSDRNAKQISLLGIEETFKVLRDKRGKSSFVPAVNSAPADASGRPGVNQVRFGPNNVTVNGMNYPLVSETGTSRSNGSGVAIYLTGDVRVEGTLGNGSPMAAPVRATIATERANPSDPAPKIVMAPSFGGTARKEQDSIALISAGDVILGLDQDNACLSNVYGVAAVAQSGAVTIAPELTTNAAPPIEDLSRRQCTGLFTFDGSLIGHNPFFARMTWEDGRFAGYRDIRLWYSDALLGNPPPYMPTVTPWGITKVKDANTVCLTTRAGDATCA